MLREPVLQTKLSAPRPQRHTLVRHRVLSLLRGALDYPLTIVQASTGYGKSTALATLADGSLPVYWYSADEGDADPQQFLAHLVTLFQVDPSKGNTALTQVQDAYADTVPIEIAANAFLNELNDLIRQPTLAVVDDYHAAASRRVNALADYFLGFLPRDLHVVVATRYPPPWENLSSWRAHGQVLDINREALAFTRDEMDALFRGKYGIDLSARDLDVLRERTEGWPAALQLIWQQLRANPGKDVVSLLSTTDSSDRATRSLETLFTYLARDVLAQQPPDVQEFLLQTSVLRELDAAACAAVSTSKDVHTHLAQLRDRDLFVISLGNGHYRYHYLFHDFLRAQAARDHPGAVLAQHRRAAEFYQEIGHREEAIYHLLYIGDFEDAARLIEGFGGEILGAGRLETLAGWLATIPSDLLAKHPVLYYYLGELARLRSRFDEARRWYTGAEELYAQVGDIPGVCKALRGQALLCLDTLHTSEAEKLLQKALRLSEEFDDGEARARLLQLLAENKLNMGRAEEAEELRTRARNLQSETPDEDILGIRVKLRTGRLNEARQVLESWILQDPGASQPPRARSSSLLMLSLIYSMQGSAEAAARMARTAFVESGSESPLISATAQMRLGHALQIGGDLEGALRCYQDAIAQVSVLPLSRVHAEVRWGMARAHGLLGNMQAAQEDAARASEMGRATGDVWVAAQVQLALGGSYALSGCDQDAIPVLMQALAAFRSCGDTFGSTAARLWLALAHWHLDQRDRALTHLDEALLPAESRHYDYLVIGRTFLGWHDPFVVAPLLLQARERGHRTTYVSRLLSAMGLEDITHHPGYQLRLHALGPFRVWRGGTCVPRQEWQRKKAKHLLQLLISQRGHWVEREAICEQLWPGGSAQASARDFKVALTTVNKVLEPERATTESPAFILREESAYSMPIRPDIWIDADEFTQLAARAEACSGEAALDLYREALALYQDDYLKMDAPYEDWAIGERERLLTVYIHAASQLAAGLFASGKIDECEEWCHKLLLRDPCWERAYRLMMRIHIQRGDMGQARRVFDQCAKVLREDLGVAPSPATLELLDQLTPSR